MNRETTQSADVLPVLGIVCGGLIPVAAFYAVGQWFFDGWLLDLGSFNLPTPVHAYFLLFYGLFGAVTAGALTVGFAGLLGRGERYERLGSWWASSSDRAWMIAAAATAILAPLVVRFLILDGARLTDDESAYLFMAELLGEGHLVADSHPAGVFFDRFAMVNDGDYYAQYFIGWPFLLMPFAAVGLAGLANPVYAGVTVVGLFLLVRRLMGSNWAKLAAVLFVASPFVVAASATTLSHTVCLMWLVWAAWALVGATEEDAPVWSHAALAVFLSAAFFTRPTVALGIGGPLVLVWALDVVRDEGPVLRRVAAFAVPAVVLAGLFLFVNRAQTGSIWTTAYQVAYEYRVNVLGGGTPGRALPNIDFWNPGNALANTAIALGRFNFAALGWVSAFLFLPFAGARGWRRIAWASLVGFLVVHFPMTDSGVDSFGPVHYFELLLPVLLLTLAGLESMVDWAEDVELSDIGVALRVEALPLALVAALVYTAAVMYVPVRWKNLRLLADQINEPRRTVEEAELGEAVVFADSLFVKCARNPDGFVGWPPYNSPGFDDPVVWANHLTLERDRKFVEKYYRGRKGYLLAWKPNCETTLESLDELEDAEVRRGRMERVR